MSSDMDDMDVDRDGQPTTLAPQDAEAALDDKYPNRPHNRSPTLSFHTLFEGLFNPLNEIKKRPTGPTVNRRRIGRHGDLSQNPHEVRRTTIERYISRWRKEVGDDIYPAFRLIIPEKDRERAMYGLKEKVLGKMFVKIMKIDKNSEDGFNLLNWKLPGQNSASRMAGDFAGRCFEVLSKRPMRTTVGDMTIGEVNEMLDQLAAAPKEENQLPILRRFYNNMNAEELMWLVRVILRQMKVGATEKTIFDVWHPDAESLFNVSSSLRRVCWELYDPRIRLEGEERGVNLMQCFQPQLAQFQMHSFQRMVDKMRPTEEDPVFWIEEKLDGERMQLHMISDDSVPGGKRFGFWSRKAKDYTYLYGNGFHDENGALTRHLINAFSDGVENIILDGEMITWDPENGQVPFGTLKTAALDQQRNPFADGNRPLLRLFDILFLNNQPLTRYTLRDRRRALEASIKPVVDRFEIHPYAEATSAADIEPRLRVVVEEASEGLVMKNPRSAYRLNDRNDDWLKVKPEYMTEFGESLDCIVIGGYYGSGHRGGNLSSFLCGLKVADRDVESATQTSQRRRKVNPMKCESFCKVGGGFTAQDYATIRHLTDKKWKPWDPKNPPKEYIELGGGDLQYERPDVWILPSDSVVLCVKAASVTQTDTFKAGVTLRFPRFKRLRTDKTWETALSRQEFLELKRNIDEERRDKEFTVDNRARKRLKTGTRTKKPLTVSGYEPISTTVPTVTNDSSLSVSLSHHPNGSDVPDIPDVPAVQIFRGLSFYVLTEYVSTTGPHRQKHTKPALESLIQRHGGTIYQTHTAAPHTLCIADRPAVRVASLKKKGDVLLIRPIWLFDCIAQAQADEARGIVAPGLSLVVPFEPQRHIFFAPEGREEEFAGNVDRFGDSYARDVGVEELSAIFAKMPDPEPDSSESISLAATKSRDGERIRALLAAAAAEDEEAGERALPGWTLRGTVLYFAPPPPPPSSSDGDDDDNDNDQDWRRRRQERQQRQQRLTALTAAFAGARIAESLEQDGEDDESEGDDDDGVTHVILPDDEDDSEFIAGLRRRVARLASSAGKAMEGEGAVEKPMGNERGRRKLPRLVRAEWVEVCVAEGTRVDEEGFVV